MLRCCKARACGSCGRITSAGTVRAIPPVLRVTPIPLGARVFALADALDAMTSDRPYRSALSWDEATDEILSQDGAQFDPQVVRAFCTRERQLHRIYEELSAAVA